MRQLLGVFVIGIVFALGLGISGMTHPDKVVAFLDFGGGWDPSLAFVMGGGLGVHALLRRFVLKRPAAISGDAFTRPVMVRADAKVIGGSALFGIGWGLSGYCPGPAFVSLATGGTAVCLFVLAMLGGMALFQLIARRLPELAMTPGCSPVEPVP